MQTFETKKTIEGFHENVVNDIQMSHDKSQLITASKDSSAKVRLSTTLAEKQVL